MSVEIRAISLEETPEFRRSVRAGFGQPETNNDDPTWAHDHTQPVDRALASFDKGSMVATLRSFATDLTVPGGAMVPAGALTAVTCQPTHHRQGLLTQMITRDLRASADRGELVDVLISSEYPIYGRFGYGPAVWSTHWEIDTKQTAFRYGGSGNVELVDNETHRKEAPGIFDRVRAGRPGMINRSEHVWDHASGLTQPPEDRPWTGFRALCRDEDGVPQGWASWQRTESWEGLVPRSTAKVSDLCAATPAAEARLLRFLTELDLVATLSITDRPDDELVPLLLSDARAARMMHRFDFLWVRPLDVVGALESRSYAAEGQVVIEVTDRLGIADGRYALEATADGASCRRTQAAANLTMPVSTLGAVFLGGPRLGRLHAAGWLDEETAGAVSIADQLFAGAVTPWCNTWF